MNLILFDILGSIDIYYKLPLDKKLTCRMPEEDKGLVLLKTNSNSSISITAKQRKLGSQFRSLKLNLLEFA